MAFPLAERELTRNGRHWRTYALRVAATGLPCVALMFATPISVVDAADPAAVGEAVSSILLRLSVFFQYVVAFMVAPMYCAGAIAQEKQERTLGLLMMADFRGWDVYAAKYISAFMQCALLIASTLPLLAISAILGGISLPAATARFILLLTATGTVCALGLLASTLARKPSEALYITAFFIVAWLFGSSALDQVTTTAGTTAPRLVLGSIGVSEPAWNIALAGRERDSFLELPSNWIPGAIGALAISVVSIGLALFLLPKQVYQKTGTPRRTKARGFERILIRRILRLRPATALIHALMSEQRAGPGSGLLRVLLPITALLLGLIPIAGWVLVFAVLCYDLSTSITHLRRNQAYDDLLVADLGVEAIAHSTWRALLVHSWPYFFGFVSAFTTTAGLFTGMLSSVASAPSLAVMLIVIGAFVGGGVYAFGVATSCAVAVLRWGAVGQTLAGAFIFGWIQMFFVIGLMIYMQGLMAVADGGGLTSGAAMVVLFGVGISVTVYAGLTTIFRRGFENDFSYTLRNPDRMTVVSHR